MILQTPGKSMCASSVINACIGECFCWRCIIHCYWWALIIWQHCIAHALHRKTLPKAVLKWIWHFQAFVQMLQHSPVKHRLRFAKYDQSAQCRSIRESSVSYAAAAVTVVWQTLVQRKQCMDLCPLDKHCTSMLQDLEMHLDCICSYCKFEGSTRHVGHCESIIHNCDNTHSSVISPLSLTVSEGTNLCMHIVIVITNKHRRQSLYRA